MFNLIEAKKLFKALWREYNRSWRSYHKELSEYILSDRGRFMSLTSRPNYGDKRNQNILDDIATKETRITAAGLQGGLTSPARPWVKLTLRDKDLAEKHNVREWLDQATRRLLSILALSNFYGSIHTIYQELVVFGTASMWEEEYFKTVVKFYPFTAGEYVLGMNEYREIDTFGRLFWLRNRDVVGMFGKDKVSARRLVQMKSQPYDWAKIAQLVVPNPDYIPGEMVPENQKYLSIYWDDAFGENFLREEYMKLFPLLAPRWDITSSDVYGRGPGMMILPDVKMLQRMQDKYLKALYKFVDPPLRASPSLKKEKKTQVAGGITYVDPVAGKGGFEPLYSIDVNIFNVLSTDIEKVHAGIRTGLFNDLFLMLAGLDEHQMSATEVRERHEEKLLILGPVIERLQTELLDPIVLNTLSIMKDYNLLPEIPDELRDEEIVIEYISLLAQAQKLVGTTAVEQTVRFVGEVAQLKPEVLDKLNADKVVEHYADLTGFPAQGLNSDDEAEQIRAQRAKAEAAQQAAEQANAMTQGAKTLSDTQMDKNSALDALLGGMGGGGTG